MSTNSLIPMFDNPQTRCPVALLLDTSQSMLGDPIAELNRGTRLFVEEVLKDDFARFAVELTIITFGGVAQVAQPFTPLANVTGGENMPVFQAGGGTPMGAAIERGLSMLEQQKASYRHKGIPYYQPWMVVLTDGHPTDAVQTAAQRVHSLSAARKLVFLGVGVGDGFDLAAMAAICPPNRPPKRLAGLQFAEFFEWLSRSMAQVSRSASPEAKVHLPPTDGWESI